MNCPTCHKDNSPANDHCYACGTDFPKRPERRAEEDSRAAPGSAINVIFDGPPGPESGRFVEVETDDGYSINAGEWIERPDGMWALRITHLPNEKLTDLHPMIGVDAMEMPEED